MARILKAETNPTHCNVGYHNSWVRDPPLRCGDRTAKTSKEGGPMKSILITCALLFGNQRCLADDTSGPNRSTIQKFAWGSLYFEPRSIGPFQLESNNDGFRLRSNQGEVSIQGSEVNGYRLTWGKEFLTISQSGGELDIRGQDKAWTLRSQNGRYTLISSAPRDTLVFERSGNTFSIKGSKGLVTATKEFQTLHIKSPLGNTTITNDIGKRTMSGIALGQIPYLGRGLYIPFHGVGIFIDIERQFPMQEVAEWVEWKPILGL